MANYQINENNSNLNKKELDLDDPNFLSNLKCEDGKYDITDLLDFDNYGFTEWYDPIFNAPLSKYIDSLNLIGTTYKKVTPEILADLQKDLSNMFDNLFDDDLIREEMKLNEQLTSQEVLQIKPTAHKIIQKEFQDIEELDLYAQRTYGYNNIMNNFRSFSIFSAGSKLYQMLVDYCQLKNVDLFEKLRYCFLNKNNDDDGDQDVLLSLIPKTAKMSELLQTKIYTPLPILDLPQVNDLNNVMDTLTRFIFMSYLIPVQYILAFKNYSFGGFRVHIKFFEYLVKLSLAFGSNRYKQVVDSTFISMYRQIKPAWDGLKEIDLVGAVNYLRTKEHRCLLFKSDSFVEIYYKFRPIVLDYVIFGGNSLAELTELPHTMFVFNAFNILGTIIIPEEHKWLLLFGMDLTMIIDLILFALENNNYAPNYSGFVVEFKNCAYLFLGEVEVQKTLRGSTFFFILHKIVPTFAKFKMKTIEMFEDLNAHIIADGYPILTFQRNFFGIHHYIYDYVSDWADRNNLQVDLGGLQHELYDKLLPMEMYYVVHSPILLESLIVEYLLRSWDHYTIEIDRGALWETGQPNKYYYKPAFDYNFILCPAQLYIRYFSDNHEMGGCFEEKLSQTYDESMNVAEDDDEKYAVYDYSNIMPTAYCMKDEDLKAEPAMYIDFQLLTMFMCCNEKIGGKSKFKMLQYHEPYSSQADFSDLANVKTTILNEVRQQVIPLNIDDIDGITNDHKIVFGHCIKCNDCIYLLNIYNLYYHGWKLKKDLCVHQMEVFDSFRLEYIRDLNLNSFLRNYVRMFFWPNEFREYQTASRVLLDYSKYIEERVVFDIEDLLVDEFGDNDHILFLNFALICFHKKIDRTLIWFVGHYLTKKFFKNFINLGNQQFLDKFAKITNNIM